MINSPYDLVIIGGGPAGLTAGIYAQRAGLKTILLEKELAGGQVNEAPLIDNYPGFESIPGMELAEKIKKHALSNNLIIETRTVQNIEDRKTLKQIATDKGVVEAKTILIATGAKPRKLGVEGEKEFLGRGVSYCGTCDGPLFKNKIVASIGGGDRALKEGVFLSNIVDKLYIIHRRDEFRAEKINVDRLKKKENVEFILNSVLNEIKGEKIVNLIKIKNVKTGDISELPVNGVFVFVGIVPRNDFVDAQKDKSGFLITDQHLQTSISGIYAAGDCRSKIFRQIATAVGEGAQAVASVEEHLHTIS